MVVHKFSKLDFLLILKIKKKVERKSLKVLSLLQ